MSTSSSVSRFTVWRNEMKTISCLICCVTIFWETFCRCYWVKQNPCTLSWSIYWSKTTQKLLITAVLHFHTVQSAQEFALSTQFTASKTPMVFKQRRVCPVRPTRVGWWRTKLSLLSTLALQLWVTAEDMEDRDTVRSWEETWSAALTAFYTAAEPQSAVHLLKHWGTFTVVEYFLSTFCGKYYTFDFTFIWQIFITDFYIIKKQIICLV